MGLILPQRPGLFTVGMNSKSDQHCIYPGYLNPNIAEIKGSGAKAQGGDAVVSLLQAFGLPPHGMI